MFAEEKPSLQPLPLEPFRYYQHGERTVHLDGCIEVEAAYYSAPPRRIGRRVQVQWNLQWVRLLDPTTGQLLREHLREHRSPPCGATGRSKSFCWRRTRTVPTSRISTLCGFGAGKAGTAQSLPASAELSAGAWHCLCDLLPGPAAPAGVFRHLIADRPAGCPVADNLAHEAISLPIFPELTAEEHQAVVNAVEDFVA
jgi:hypothetical protein